MGRRPSLLLFLCAYLVALLLAPAYDSDTLSQGLRLLFTACGLSLFTSFLVFVLSFRPEAPRPYPRTAQGDDYAE